MKREVTLKRTDSNNADFQHLIILLDYELWNELNEDQATYDQYNKVYDLNTVVVLYKDDCAVAIGCFKKYNDDTVEIKRMFVKKENRAQGLSKLVLEELENWARELGFKYSILETSVHFETARGLYTKAGYYRMENYDQYSGLAESVCMKKEVI